MMKDVLRQLCVEVGWSYAVFWRAIGAPNPTHFVWEDGCSQPARRISGFEAMDLLLKEQGLVRSSSNGNFAEVGCQTEDKIRVLVQNMMLRRMNVLGDGIVGQAAVTGDHYWILRDNFSNHGTSPNVLAELNNQFVSGIQTIAVIPVLPYGVAQLGSTQMVMEDVGFVNHLRSLFRNLGQAGSLFISSTSKALGEKGQVFRMPDTEYMGTLGMRGDGSSGEPSFTMLRCNMQSSSVDASLIKQVVAASSSFRNIQPENDTIGKTGLRSKELMNSSKPTSIIGNSAPLSSGLSYEASLKNSDLKINISVGNFCDVQGGIGETVHELAPNGIVSKITQASNSEDFRMSHPSVVDGGYENVVNAGKSEIVLDKDFHNESVKFGANGFCSEPQFSTASISEVSHGQLQKFAPFFMEPTSENDLFDIVGLDCRISSNSSGLLKDDNNNIFSSEKDVGPSLDPLDYDISCSKIFMESEPEQLLDAVVSNLKSSVVKRSLEESVSCKTSITNISSSLIGPTSGVFGNSNSAQQKQGETFSIKSEGCSQKNGGYNHKSQINLWVESGQNLKSSSASAVPCRMVEEPSKMNRKRARSGESRKPRPKDRQMIQDRIKELREIVPNSAKCSIDALLEKTIKHMLFLHSVTKHGDKLKDTGEPKIISKDGGLLLKDNFDGGATWAFEVGTQSMICPIIVEDLNPPRQMLVEMLCDDRGFFLEIADLIRGLGLTILKGVMEAREDKIWARFAVEANRDVTRMEIFLSLVRLLEPSAASGVAQGSDNIKMPQNAVHQQSIPVTGSSDRLI